MHTPRGTAPISRPINRTSAILNRPRTGTSGRLNLPMPPVEAATYRPRGALAATMLVAPALVLLAMTAVILIADATGVARLILLGTGSGLALAWLVCATLFGRVLLVTVRTTTEGIEANYPGGGSQLLRWQIIDHVDRQLGFVRMHSSDGHTLMFIEGGLTNGQRLLRQTLLRASPTVLSPTLQQELALLGGGLFKTTYQPPTPRLGLSPVWLGLAGIAGVTGLALAAWGSLMHAGLLLAIGVGVGLVGVFCLLILRQAITITDTGFTVDRGFGAPVTLTWSEIKLIEYVPLEMMQALRGERRVIFIGSFFMTPSRRDLLRTSFQKHLESQGVPVLQRWFIV